LRPRLRPEAQVEAGGRGFGGNDSPRGDEKLGEGPAEKQPRREGHNSPFRAYCVRLERRSFILRAERSQEVEGCDLLKGEFTQYLPSVCGSNTQ
jgi:hypothetical protein